VRARLFPPAATIDAHDSFRDSPNSLRDTPDPSETHRTVTNTHRTATSLAIAGGFALTVAAMRTFLTTAVAVAAFLALTGTAQAEWVWPLRGQVITTYRNGDDPYAGGQHRGIDIAGPVGARVVAAAGGEVRFAGTAGSSGLTVSVRTTDGFDTSYLHLSSVSVREGQLVSSGDALGAVGMTGARSALEPHLHLGVREAGSRHAYRNPLDLLPPAQAPPTPEAPQPTPGPAPVPTPLAPGPAPAGEPAPRRVPIGGRAPQRVPAWGRVPAGERSPGRVPTGEPSPRRGPIGDLAPRGVRAPAGAPAPHPTSVPDHPPSRLPADEDALRRLPVGERAPHRVEADGRARRGAPESLRLGSAPGQPLAPRGQPLTPERSRPSEDRATTAPESARRGPDIGWIIACVGLLLAAAFLGLTEDGRKASRNGRGHLARLLRPLTGRR
jgi:murein DD-endopeptidase MepM/ murein hydrolase activator NlpD